MTKVRPVVLATLPLGTSSEGAVRRTGQRTAVARLSPATAGSVGAVDGAEVTVATDVGSLTLPLVVTAMPDGVVWLPANSDGSTPRATLGAGHGDVVRISGGVA